MGLLEKLTNFMISGNTKDSRKDKDVSTTVSP